MTLVPSSEALFPLSIPRSSTIRASSCRRGQAGATLNILQSIFYLFGLFAPEPVKLDRSMLFGNALVFFVILGILVVFARVCHDGLLAYASAGPFF